jgi:hypothetical protein
MPDPRGLADALEREGLLLASDATLPSVATLVAGMPVRGSWWGHPKGRAIFAAIRALEHHPDAVAVLLVRGKVTFVHRRLWPALLAITQSGEAWQRRGLSAAARALLAKVRRSGSVQASGDAVRDIERRLRARVEEVHTERGGHAKQLETWDRWAAREHVTPAATVAEAKASIEAAVERWGTGRTSRGLPWFARR